ncbi:MAG: hypothetical protein IPK83_04315 [Planctomycetes bacterium]|nr:hypothetical protein [Planctomycetota bacterium]
MEDATFGVLPCDPEGEEYAYSMALRLIDAQSDWNRRSDLRSMFEERAAVMEYCGGLTKRMAELLALRELRAMAFDESDS